MSCKLYGECGYDVRGRTRTAVTLREKEQGFQMFAILEFSGDGPGYGRLASIRKPVKPID